MAPNRPFLIAFAISTLFHLSMVSVFSIMIWFPRKDVQYCTFILVRPESAQPPSSRMAQRDRLRVPSPDNLLETAESAAGTAEPEDNPWGSLPPIKLPKLEFVALDRLQTPEESLRIRSQFSDFFEQRPPADSWARFSHELRGIGPALSRWAGPAPEEASVQPVGNPAPGFEIYIKWMSAPKDRALLFSPPIQALWNTDPGDLIEPISLVFTVNPQGKVTEIQFPVEDEAGVIANIGQALLKYRFEPLADLDATKDQRGTLLVAPAQQEK